MMKLSDDIAGLLIEINEDFLPSLSSTINIQEYANKIVQNAQIISYQHNNTLAAFIAFYCNDVISRTAFLSMLAVSKENRGYGVALALLKSSIDIITRKGYTKYRLEVYKSNDKAISLYHRNEFIIVAETDYSYYMEKNLY